jgi:hypothetical protein
MKLRRYVAPTLLAGVLLIGGTTTFAYQGGTFNPEAFKDFSSDEIRAIEEAFNLRQSANEAAEKILSEAGVDRKKLRDVTRSYHSNKHKAMSNAINTNDYEAFVSLFKEAPFPDAKIPTSDEFSKMVQAHKLMKSGDKETAKEIMSEIGIKPHGFRYDKGRVL